MFTVRRALLDDLNEIAELAAELVRMHHAFDPRRFMLVEPIAQGYRWFFGQELERPEAVILVARHQDSDGTDGPVLGYAYATLEPRNWNDLLDKAGKLNDIFVDPAARRQGVGRALIDAATKALKELGAPRVVLLTAWQNESAHALFESMGFRRTMLEMTAEIEAEGG